MKATHDDYLSETPKARHLAGNESVALKFANHSFHFHQLSLEQKSRVIERFGETCLRATSEADVDIFVYGAPASIFRTRDMRGWEYRIAISYQSASVQASGLGFTAQMERSSLKTDLFTDRHDDTFLNVFENTLRVVSTYQLLRSESIVMHSAGIADTENAFVLFGASGAGKSTLCEIAHRHGLRILSDELNAIQLSRESTILPMPFAGDFGAAPDDYAPLPLSGICALTQASHNALHPCKRAESLSRLVASCPFVNADPYAQPRLFELAEKLSARHTVQNLHFVRDISFWETLKRNDIVHDSLSNRQTRSLSHAR